MKMIPVIFGLSLFNKYLRLHRSGVSSNRPATGNRYTLRVEARYWHYASNRENGQGRLRGKPDAGTTGKYTEKKITTTRGKPFQQVWRTYCDCLLLQQVRGQDRQVIRF